MPEELEQQFSLCFFVGITASFEFVQIVCEVRFLPIVTSFSSASDLL
jgi:hypothetical protein